METGQRVAQAIYFALACGVIMVAWHWLTESVRPGGPTRWDMVRNTFMSRYFVQADDQADEQEGEKEELSAEERKDESPESSVATPKEEGSEKFRFPDVFAALAGLVKEGKLTESDALRLGIGVAPGGSTRYKEARKRLTAALDALQPDKFPPLTQEQIDNRRDLGLPIQK